MVVAFDPRRAVASNKIGGVYARSVAGRVLVAGRSGVGRKNSGRAAAQAVPIWVDEADQLPLGLLVESDGFLPFFGAGLRVVAWPPSHGSMQAADMSAFFVDPRIITNLHHAAGSHREGWGAAWRHRGQVGGAPPHRPVFVWGHPCRAGAPSPMGYASLRDRRSLAFILKAGRGRVAKLSRGRMGSGVRGAARAGFSVRGGATGVGCGVGQGAIAAVLAQGGSAMAKLGGGAGHVNAT